MSVFLPSGASSVRPITTLLGRGGLAIRGGISRGFSAKKMIPPATTPTPTTTVTATKLSASSEKEKKASKTKKESKPKTTKSKDKDIKMKDNNNNNSSSEESEDEDDEEEETPQQPDNTNIANASPMIVEDEKEDPREKYFGDHPQILFNFAEVISVSINSITNNPSFLFLFFASFVVTSSCSISYLS